MRTGWRKVAHRALELSGLIGPLHRAQERRLAQADVEAFDDGRPLPPAELRVLVGGAADPKWFSHRGRADAERFMDLARRHGSPFESGLSVWDLGCGCGRIARWTAPVVLNGGGAFRGTDINPRLVEWCAAHLAGSYRRNPLKPPSDLAPESIEVIYAYSVLTHLREGVARAWLAEMARVLKPGGLAMVTFHDEDYARAWGPPEAQAQIALDGYFVLNDALEGSNYMSSWTTRQGFRALLPAQLEVCEIRPGQLDAPVQAIAVLRRRTV
ncbi:MAG: class I SAM-dependent methyltransferase [Phenylobacterium sp.]|uniref:class I SAM-dependent methyltransferase n=1 Tax=Phenylobacterium sp. TaxID=1871053 RepID=UPI00391D3A2E